ELGEKLELERLGQVGDAAGAARAALVADDALDGLQVVEAPELEVVVQVDELLGELVQVPAAPGVVVDAEPGTRDLLARLVGLAEVAHQVVLGNLIAAAA